MAENEIKRDGYPPIFVDPKGREGETYNGVADTVGLWAKARVVVMSKSSGVADPPREDVIEVFQNMLRGASKAEVDKYVVEKPETRASDKNITFGDIGRAALGGDLTEEVA
jgi:hypothetical protein